MTATVTPMRPGYDPAGRAAEEACALRTVSEVMRVCAVSLPRASSIRTSLAAYSVTLAERAAELLAPPDDGEAS